MTCSIIIRAYNEEAHLGKLLDGIRQQETAYPIEVILVDSGSTDATVRIAAERGARVLHIRPEEFSFGRALNLGCRAATGDILLFASAHVYPVYTDWIARMLAPFADPKVALVYGRQVGDHRSHYAEHRVFAKWFPPESNPVQTIPFCNNANAAIRRTHWEQRPYDESLTGLEDLAWGTQALREGYYLAYEAGAVIVHVHEETPRKIFNRYYREAIAFKRIVPEARFGLWDFLHLTTSNILSDYWAALREGVLRKNGRSISAFRLMQFWGTYQGYRFVGTLSRSLRARFYYPNELRREVPQPAGRVPVKQVVYE